MIVIKLLKNIKLQILSKKFIILKFIFFSLYIIFSIFIVTEKNSFKV